MCHCKIIPLIVKNKSKIWNTTGSANRSAMNYTWSQLLECLDARGPNDENLFCALFKSPVGFTAGNAVGPALEGLRLKLSPLSSFSYRLFCFVFYSCTFYLKEEEAPFFATLLLVF